MIDTDKYEGHTEGPWKHNDKWGLIKYGQIEITALHSGNSANAKLIADAPLLLAEVKQLREENETLRKMDWEYECLWTWLAENTNLLNTIEPLMEEWKKEYDEE
jgi:hypothetical protein